MSLSYPNTPHLTPVIILSAALAALPCVSAVPIRANSCPKTLHLIYLDEMRSEYTLISPTGKFAGKEDKGHSHN